MLIRKIMILIVMSLFSTIALAQSSAPELGPAVGEKIPHDLSLMATSGKMENFETLVGENGMAIFFVRSFGWCPYCQKQAIEVNGQAVEFESRGYNPIFISYDKPDIQKNFYDKWKFTVPILSDNETEVIQAFDILNEATSKDSPLYGYPHPIVFIVGNDGVIRSKLYIENENAAPGSNYKERPEINVILATIDDLD